MTHKLVNTIYRFNNNISNSQCIIKKIDIMRLEKNDNKSLNNVKDKIFEYILLNLAGKMLKHINQENH